MRTLQTLLLATTLLLAPAAEASINPHDRIESTSTHAPKPPDPQVTVTPAELCEAARRSKWSDSPLAHYIMEEVRPMLYMFERVLPGFSADAVLNIGC